MTCSYLPTPFLVILAMVQLRIDFTDFAGRISISYLARNLQTRSWTLLNCIYDSAKWRWDTLSYWLDISWHFHGRGKLQEVGLLRNFMISSARGSQDSSTPEECVTLLAGVPAKDVMTKTFFTLETFGDQTKQHDTQEYYGNLWNVGTCWYMLVHYAHSHTVSLFHYFSHLYDTAMCSIKCASAILKHTNRETPHSTTTCPTEEWQLTLPSEVPKVCVTGSGIQATLTPMPDTLEMMFWQLTALAHCRFRNSRRIPQNSRAAATLEALANRHQLSSATKDHHRRQTGHAARIFSWWFLHARHCKLSCHPSK